MEDIYIQTELDKKKTIKFLEGIFPDFTVFHYSFGSKKPKNLDLENPLHIFFHTVKKYSNDQFDFELRIYRTSSDCETQRTLFIAKKLSFEFSVPTLVRSTTFLIKSQDAQSSLSDILFQDGKAFIVNKSLSIEKEYYLPSFKFDSKADFIGVEQVNT